MKFATFCSGICAPECAWHPLGWEPLFFSEIEPFAQAVESHRFPGVPQLGDMEKIDDETLARFKPSLVCAGTPCQAFSVAGLRKGLDDPRGNLTLVFLRLLDRLRPAWVVWENVPGVLSIDGGRAFGAFLGGLGQLGYGFAYRVLDAQHFGVPQRRRRVFVVGHLGDWRRAAAVLFERHSLSGHPAPRRETGARVAASLTRGASSSGRGGYAGRRQEDDYSIVGGVTGTLPADYGKQGGNGMGEMEHGLITHALRGDGFDVSEDGTGRGMPLVPATFNWQSGGTQTRIGYDPESRVSGTVQANQIPAVAFTQNSRDEVRFIGGDGGIVGALAAEPGMKQQNYIASSGVRRLTPRECEKLQGFSPDWTLVPYRGKPAADGPRYRAIGNSMAVPVMAWLGQRIAAVEAIPHPDGRTKERA